MTPRLPDSSEDLDALARRLEASGEYRVLKKLPANWSPRVPPTDVAARLGLVVDVETTGLDPARDEIIELAMVPFTYGLDGEVYAVGEPFHGLRQPSFPIPAAITAITGIDDAMVAGQRLDSTLVAAFAAQAALVIAHNAAFDRRFLERFCDTFTTKPWACSMQEVDWAAEGYEGTKLAYLAAQSGFFYERHRATHDCLAAISLLARVQPRSGRTALSQLLDRARSPVWRIWAENAPFELKDALKARGYRWNPDAARGPRAWFIDVDAERREGEIAFLQAEIYCGEIVPLVRRIDAYDRYSDRT
jgi:DNA polymerase-3 subunit epsilon